MKNLLTIVISLVCHSTVWAATPMVCDLTKIVIPETKIKEINTVGHAFSHFKEKDSMGHRMAKNYAHTQAKRVCEEKSGRNDCVFHDMNEHPGQNGEMASVFVYYKSVKKVEMKLSSYEQKKLKKSLLCEKLKSCETEFRSNINTTPNDLENIYIALDIHKCR